MTDYRRQMNDFYSKTTALPALPGSKVFANRMRQYRVRWARYLPKDPNAVILDVGCGYGEFLLFLKSLGYSNIMGIDIGPEQVQTAAGFGLNVVVADAVQFLAEKESSSVDVICLLNVLEHLERDELVEVLSNAARVCKSGGLIFVVVPNSSGPFGSRVLWSDITHERSFTPRAIEQMVKTVGNLRIVAIREHGPLIHGPIIYACINKATCYIMVSGG